MKVLKFGGSSVSTPGNLKQVNRILSAEKKPVLVVVSAFSGVTDQLVSIAQQAREGDEGYKEILEDIENRHYDTIRSLFSARDQSGILAGVKVLINELEDNLYGTYLLRDLTPKTYDRILCTGELLSSHIMSFLVSDGVWVDSRTLIRTDDSYGNARVDFDLTNKTIRKHFEGFQQRGILPGFMGSDPDGNVTTLGRGGSDYSASILAAALDADILEIWTDVDGFMTADPRRVERAYPIAYMSYAEAMELSHFGAKVIYTPTIQPVYQKKIPIALKNTFKPDIPGTTIGLKKEGENGPVIKGISSIDDITLITLQGAGLAGVTGTAMRLFGALARHEINIILITQASSEFSITFAVRPDDAARANRVIREEFSLEIESRQSVNISMEEELSIIAIVGEGMINTPGISSKLFGALARNGISVIATAQGSSEMNISVVIRKESLKKALNAIHEDFFLSSYKEVHLFQAGVGNVGKILLKQIRAQQEKLMKEEGIKINVVGLTHSRKMFISEKGIDLDRYEKIMENGHRTNLKEFIEGIRELNLRNSIFIDCTADEEISQKYLDLFNIYVNVVTANKIACSSEYSLYRKLKDTSRKKGVRFIFETNVGAGLPVIKTINDLISSGDRILGLEAVLSGTLNFIFNTIREDIPFSQAVRMAMESGYSEPDPRQDLSGTDVIRKLMILARESGYPVERHEVQFTPLLPGECFEGSLEEFWEKIKPFDEHFEKERQKLAERGEEWRFMARLKDGVPSVSLTSVPSNHPSSPMEGSNNIILLTTERYKDHPMIIKGYGAGAEVTAAGLFADIISLAYKEK